jgi:hypothetical protein
MTLPGQETCLHPMFHLTMDPPPPTIEDLGDLPPLDDTLARKSINYHGPKQISMREPDLQQIRIFGPSSRRTYTPVFIA